MFLAVVPVADDQVSGRFASAEFAEYPWVEILDLDREVAEAAAADGRVKCDGSR